jgi:hypothetical protein
VACSRFASLAATASVRGLPVRTIRRGLDAIQAQEGDARAERRARVAVHERVIPADVEEIRRGDFHDVGVRRLTTERGLRRVIADSSSAGSQ